MIEIDSLYQGDCLELMKDIPDKSVDCVICDLPYMETRAKWDKEIDLNLLWVQYKRIIKSNGAIVLFGNEPFSSKLRLSNESWYRYDWKWIKSNCTGFANANYRPMRKYEDIIIFSKANASSGGRENNMVYNPQGLKEIGKVKKNTKNRFGLIDTNNANRGKDNVMCGESVYVQKFTNYPNNVLFYDFDAQRIHPTQKPVSLIEYLVKTYTNEGDVVLDNCIGSGTTAIACINTNRHFIGMELDEGYFSKACERIEKELLEAEGNGVG